MRNCKECGNHLTLPEPIVVPCNEKEWAEWEIEEADNLKEIESLLSKGHTHHCACRIVWGDGECTCAMEKSGYDPYWWMKPTTSPKG